MKKLLTILTAIFAFASGEGYARQETMTNDSASKVIPENKVRKEITDDRWREGRAISLLAGYESNQLSAGTDQLIVGDSTGKDLQGWNLGLAFEFQLTPEIYTYTIPGFSYTQSSETQGLEDRTFNSTVVKVNQSFEYRIPMGGSTVFSPFVDVGLGFGSIYQTYTERNAVFTARSESESIGLTLEASAGVMFRVKERFLPFVKATYRNFYTETQRQRTTFDSEIESFTETEKNRISSRLKNDLSSVGFTVGIGYTL